MYYFSFSMLSFALFFFFTKFLRVLKHFLYKSTLPLKKTPNKQTPPPKHPPPPTHVQFTHNKASSEKSVTSLYYTNLQYAYPQPSEIKSVCLHIELLSVNTA